MKILSLLTIPVMVSPLCSAFAVPLATQGNKVVTTQNLQQHLKVAGLLNNPVKQLKAFMDKDNYAFKLNNNYFKTYWPDITLKQVTVQDFGRGGDWTNVKDITYQNVWNTNHIDKDSDGYYVLPLVSVNSAQDDDVLNNVIHNFTANFGTSDKVSHTFETDDQKINWNVQATMHWPTVAQVCGSIDLQNYSGDANDCTTGWGWWEGQWKDAIFNWAGTNAKNTNNKIDIFSHLTRHDNGQSKSFGIAKYGFDTVDLEKEGCFASASNDAWKLYNSWTSKFKQSFGGDREIWFDKPGFDTNLIKHVITSACFTIQNNYNHPAPFVFPTSDKTGIFLSNLGASNDVAGVLYYDVRNLIQLDSVGFDKEQQKYFTTTGLNENLVAGTLGMKYNRDFIDNVYNRDFSNVYQDDKGVWHVKSRSEATNLLLNNCFYYHDILGMTNIGGGVQTWADENIVSSGEYASWMGALKNILADLIDNHYCCYDNYFAIKRYVQDYVKEHLQLPNLDALIHEIKEGKLKTNGWYNFVDQYGLDETSLDALCLILPQLKLSEWNMDAEATASASNNAGFNNIEQTNYIGRREEPITHTKYSTGLDLFEPNCNKYYLQTTSTEGDDIVYLHNVKNLDTTYSSTKVNGFASVESSDTAEDVGGMVNVTTLKGLDRISQQTAGAVYETTASFTSSTGTHNNLGAIGIKKNGVIIANVEEAEKQGLFAQVDVKENLLASRSDDVWAKALSDAGGDTIKALKSIYINNIINDPQPALPFVEINLYDNDSYEFNLDTLGDRRLEVSADGHLGTLTTNLVASDGSVISTYTTHGFDTSDHPQPIIDPTTGLSPGAIAGITIGSIAGASVLAFGGYKGVKFAKFKKKEKEFNSKK